MFSMATAGSLWPARAIVQAQTNNTVQDTTLARHEETLKKIDTLSDQLSEANKHMAVMETRFNDEVKHGARE
ncbi:hypothetical protein [Stenotrophomonas sp. AG209]|uniref:hypothetical protein n=1 Tax=Stenotrophomonas sp. AG209 TaxID=2183909 RepID=UPI000E5B90E7|nr:hypothetical protein [Stenotrophomonas sp. AG209]